MPFRSRAQDWVLERVGKCRGYIRLRISFVAALLFVAVNNTEPNRLYALALKLLIVFVSVAAIAGRVTP